MKETTSTKEIRKRKTRTENLVTFNNSIYIKRLQVDGEQKKSNPQHFQVLVLLKKPWMPNRVS